jgi:DNA repair exonuclease SbcCD ATPase subunit
MRRIPEGIKEAVEHLSDLYRESVWDGRVDSLNKNLISGNGTQDDLGILLQKLLSKLADDGELSSLPSELREEFLSRVQVGFNSKGQKLDIEYTGAAASSCQGVDVTSEIEEPTFQVSSDISSNSSTLQAEEPSNHKLDIEYSDAELILTLKESKTLIKKLERQVKAQAEQIQRLSKRVNERRKEKEEYKQKWLEAERLISQLTSQYEKVKEQAADRDTLQSNNEQMQQELEELHKKAAFLSAEAEDKQKMLSILQEAINPELQLVGKIKTAIQIALAAGRGDYRENIDSALHYLQEAIAALDISTGYEYEKKALELVGEKPRRAKK